MILKNNWLNLLSLCHFPLNSLSAGMYGQTDGQTDGRADELIRVELGNLRFVQINDNGIEFFTSNK